MSVQLNVPSGMGHLTGSRATVEVNGATVGQCLADLVRQFPKTKSALFNEKGKLLDYIEIYLNLESSYPEELAKPVQDGDRLDIITVLSGG